MQWDNLKKLDITELVDYINEKLREHKSLQKVAIELGTSNESTIRKYITNRGYKRVGYEFVLTEYTCKPECNTKENRAKKDSPKINDIDIMQKPDFKENMLYLSTETETIKEIIDWFKYKEAKSNTDIIEIRAGININLPESPIKRTTIRINEKVWDMFNELVEENKPIDKHDIMGMALLECINKYKK